MTLAAILASGGCSTVQAIAEAAGLCPVPEVEIRPSTFCQSYQPIEARAKDPAAAPGSPAFEAFWTDLPGAVGPENDIRIRGNNAAYLENCL